MPSKQMHVREEVHGILQGLKGKGDSFSDVIIRLVRVRAVSDFAGLWSDLPEEDKRELRDALSHIQGSASVEG